MVFKTLIDKISQLRENQGFIKYFKNTSWLLFEKGLRILSVIFIGAWVARYLGPDNFGVFTYSNSIVAMFMPIAMMGLNDIIIKELVKNGDKNQHNQILGTSFIIKLSSGVIAFILVLISILLFQNNSQTIYLILIFSLHLIIQSFDVFDLHFQSQVKSKFAVYARLIALIISNIIKIILIVTDSELIWFAGVVIFEFFITNIMYGYYYNLINQSILKWRFNMELAKKYLSSSWPLFLSGLMYVFYIRIDQIMVKEILGNKSAGIYAVAISLSEVWYFVPQIIASSLFPAILQSKLKSKNLYTKRLTHLYFILFWIAIIIALGMTLFGDFIISQLYGESYRESFTILNIYIWSNVFFFFTTVSSKWLISENLYLYSFYRNAIGAAVNIILNFILLNTLGLIGAAISTLISYSVVGLFYDLVNKKLRENFRIKIKSILCIT